MKYYAVLAIATALLIFFAARLWARTRNISFPLGLAFLYYWTLQGAWVLVHDRLESTSNAAYHYSGYEERLFPILLDNSYFQALLLYSLFLVITAATLVLLVRRPRDNSSASTPVLISHWRLVAIASLAGMASFYIVRQALNTAADRDLSMYEYTRQDFATNSLFTLHQLLNRVMLFAVCFGLCVFCCGVKGKYVVGKRSASIFLCYLAVLAGVLYFMSLLGNRNEVVFAGIAAILFYCVNSPRPKIIPAVAAFAILMLSISFIYNTRGAPASEQSEAAESFDPTGLWGFLQTSNEQFVAHFSLYGVIKHDTPLTYGSSIVSLVASLVPRALWPDRPPDIYDYYAEATKAAPGQGYTIHYATGWYLNFGIYGVALGGIVLGLVWACLYNWFNQTNRSGLFIHSIKLLAVWTFVANLPSLVRAGPEGYKSAIFEAILMPAIILTISARSFLNRQATTSSPQQLDSRALSTSVI